MNVLVTGAGGFIGGHLVRTLAAQGHTVRAVDIKPIERWHQLVPDTDIWQVNLALREDCVLATRGMEQVFNLAADMGGMGFIESHKAACMQSVLISTHLLTAARCNDVDRFFYASSACVYPDYRQNTTNNPALAEADAYPAMPEDGYGWEKLFSERMCRHYTEDYGLTTRVARYHNVYGPHGTFRGGREKAPAAICRKVIAAVLDGTHEIEIWGDGEQTRSFMFIDDCIDGTQRIMASGVDYPINLGSSELVTINQLVDIVEQIADVRLDRKYVRDAPQGVRGRNSDNTLIRKELDWEPVIALSDGLTETFRWIWNEMAA